MTLTKAAMWVLVTTTIFRALGFVVMAIGGYDFGSTFYPDLESVAGIGYVLTIITEVGAYLLMALIWIMLCANVTTTRNRLRSSDWTHGVASIWWWWLVPVLNLWKPREVFLEVLDNNHPEEEEQNSSLVTTWWLWLLAFGFSWFLVLVPGGPTYLVVAAMATVILALVVTIRAGRMMTQLEPAPSTLSTDHPPGETPTVPGWYHDPSGQASHQAWWDGSRWTGATRPGSPIPDS